MSGAEIDCVARRAPEADREPGAVERVLDTETFSVTAIGTLTPAPAVACVGRCRQGLATARRLGLASLAKND
jgi:hypothetical protein